MLMWGMLRSGRRGSAELSRSSGDAGRRNPPKVIPDQAQEAAVRVSLPERVILSGTHPEMNFFSQKSTHCLFCGRGCGEVNNEPVQLDASSLEIFGGGDSETCYSTPSVDAKPSEGEGCPCDLSPLYFLGLSLEEWENGSNLLSYAKYAFVLRKLLDYPKRSCVKYLRQQHQLLAEGGTAADDGWFSVCHVCAQAVQEAHRIQHEIEKLTAQLDDLKKKLKDELTGNDQKDGAGEGAICAQVRSYFQQKKLLSSKEGRGMRVKLEVEALDEEDLENDPLSNEIGDDGSDWAPSDDQEDDAENLNVEEVQTFIDADIKPDIAALMKAVMEEEEVGKPEDTPADAEIVDCKPGPKSRKSLRATRFSKRLNEESAEEGIAVADEKVHDTFSTSDAEKKRPKRVKSILSDTESEDTTGSDEDSDDSDYWDRSGSKESFTCDICNASYHTKHRLRDHRQLHSSDTALKCQKCPFVAVSSRGLNMHLTKIHAKKSSRSPEEKIVKRTSQVSTPPTPKKKKPSRCGEHACRFCPVVFQTAHRLREHEELHLNMTSDMLKCQHCNYICLLERGMKIHVTKYHSEKVPVEQEDSGSEEDSDGRSERKEKDYPCTICGVTYKTKHRLREHLNLHKSRDAIRCTECPFVFRNKYCLTRHMSSSHGIKPPQKVYKRKRKGKPKVYTTEPQFCQSCPAKYYTTHRFQQHIKLHASDQNYPCEECGWVFSSADKRDYHMKLSHNRRDIVLKPAPPKTYQCNHCDSPPFQLRYKFREHLLLNHKDRVFHCSTCDQLYESQQLYDLHTGKCKKVSDDKDEESDASDSTKNFTCTQCNCKYRTKDLLNKHFALKHSTEQFPCTLCSSVFPTESRLRYHMARNHDGIQNVCKICDYKAHGASHLRLHMQKHTKERLFSCELCGKTFVSPTYLTGHKQMEHYQELGLDPIKCEECNMLFPSSSILKYHRQKVHEKKFKFFCEVCGKGFLFMSGLKHHSAIHSTERNEICQFCGAAYVHNRVLMEHLKTHHPEEYAAQKGVDPNALKASLNLNLDGPFICKVCNLESSSRWALHMHLKTHTEVYDKYKCGICGKGYSSPAGLKRHEDTAHGGDVYSCQNCGKEFPCKDYLRYHIKNHCPKKDGNNSSDSAGPSTTKRQKRQAPAPVEAKQEPQVIKEAGQLHIVHAPSTITSATTTTTSLFHPIQPITLAHFQTIQPGSEQSSSSSYTSATAQPLLLNVSQEQQQHESPVSSLYRSYFAQHGFPSANK